MAAIYDSGLDYEKSFLVYSLKVKIKVSDCGGYHVGDANPLFHLASDADPLYHLTGVYDRPPLLHKIRAFNCSDEDM
ncbi:hypothetical protein Sjap_025559 [Stephania japonica]|uniref:Uncharacterized protein n=1 Tax=Stephania japonica TaxID=461633 RepID=A0AAP0E9P4_9MAGN